MGASLSWYPCFFCLFICCFGLSLSNYLAGVTSVELRKPSEAKRCAAGWMGDKQMKKMQMGKSYLKISLLNIWANWLLERRCWCDFFGGFFSLQLAAKPPTLEIRTKAQRGSIRRARTNASDTTCGDTLPRLLNNAPFCLAPPWAALDVILFFLLHHFSLPSFVPVRVKASFNIPLCPVLVLPINYLDF